MKYPALAVLLLPAATPALAHLENVPHVHGSDGALWGAALILAALVIAGVRRMNGAVPVRREDDR